MLSLHEDGDDGQSAVKSHYMNGVTYNLDGQTVNMDNYVSGFASASARTMVWTVPLDAPDELWYWCHFHPKQGNNFAVQNASSGDTTDTSPPPTPVTTLPPTPPPPTPAPPTPAPPTAPPTPDAAGLEGADDVTSTTAASILEESTDETSSSTDWGLIIGCIVGGLLLLGGGYYVYRQRQKKAANKAQSAVKDALDKAAQQKLGLVPARNPLANVDEVHISL